ncbi:MAG: MBL fold metallo-hydrolase [Acidobacteria bacterium]|nr:MBL fold metallo-hydrolase [Acidobacteriota bacterium]
MNPIVTTVLAAALVFGGSLQAQRREAPLEIYVADTEGGKSALFVTPSGETVLIDSGNPGPRDGSRILAMLQEAGVRQIDHLISTHYHVDHVGGLADLAAKIPVKHYVDHGPNVEPREQVANFSQTYAALSGAARRTVVKPGDRLPVADLDWRIVTAAGRAITAPLAGGGQANPACADFVKKNATPDENDQSVGSVVAFGQFRALDLGDLVWDREHDLVCPRNLIGPVDLYMVTHHGLDISGAPALVHAVRPRVAVMQNGTRKGGAVATFQTLRSSPGFEDIWQLHWSYHALIEHNAPGVFIANVDDARVIGGVIAPPADAPASGAGRATAAASAHVPAHAIRISAYRDGTFTVTNTRNGFSKTYGRR